MIRGLDTYWMYIGFVVLVLIERIIELCITKKNINELKSRKGVEEGRVHYRWMIILHTSLLILPPIEVLAFDRPFIMPVAIISAIVIILTMALRYWTISSLKDRWTTNIVVIPGEAPVTTGPYKYLRHPNYLAVVVEVAALPMIHSAWICAISLSIANAFLIGIRIDAEEKALESYSPYTKSLGNLPRIIPFQRRDE